MTILLLVVLAAGYVLGRLRPLSTFRDRVWRGVIWGGVTDGFRRNAYVVAFIVLFPVKFYRSFRAVRRPPPPRRPAPALSADFLARMAPTTEETP